MRLIVYYLLFISLFVISACGEKQELKNSTNVFSDYFYPIDTVPKIYLYRDVTNGIDEKFHRIYIEKKSKNSHLVVDIYRTPGKGRLVVTERLVYNIQNKSIVEHAVVDINDELKPAKLVKNGLIPVRKNEESLFASLYPGFRDSTYIYYEIKRKSDGNEIQHKVMGKDVSCIIFKDNVTQAQRNLRTKKTDVMISTQSDNYFAQGYGLVEWYTTNKKAHYKLEKIISQKEWEEIINRYNY